mmetsp:Transcript_47564/g.101763  ORF Transcript_47564/g.101763 Transcript_47564/m.101763 type:complete len:640 (+) Transcript_47564:42-1961(+)
MSEPVKLPARSTTGSSRLPSPHQSGSQPGGPTATSGSGYSAADSQGNFPHLQDEDTADFHNRAGLDIDFDELDRDPSERRPGGPVAEAVLSAGPRAYQLKWIIPLLAFLIATLVQSIGLIAATQRYVDWMEKIEDKLETTISQEPLQAPAEAKWRHQRLRERLGARDNFAAWTGLRPVANGKGFLGVVAWAIPLYWSFYCFTGRNVRLWARTLAAASLLALLKGLLTWSTLVPDSEAWDACRERLDDKAYAYFTSSASGFAGFFQGIPFVLWLWVDSLIFGMRHNQELVCGNSMSGSTYITAVFALGLFDAFRAKARRLRAMFRPLVHILLGCLLALVVLSDALSDIVSRQQYAMDVVLALLFSSLIYGSPALAIAVDSFLIRGAQRGLDSKDGCDVGDIVVPPCCLPFCYFHGRYFLFRKSAQETEADRQAQERAAATLQQMQLDQEATTRRILELEAELESVRQRTQVRERQEALEAERRLNEQLAELQNAHDLRISKRVAQFEEEVQKDTEIAKRLQDDLQVEEKRISTLEETAQDESVRFTNEISRLQGEIGELHEARASKSASEAEELKLIEELQAQAMALNLSWGELMDLSSAGFVVDAVSPKVRMEPEAAKRPYRWLPSVGQMLMHPKDYSL